MLERCFIKWCRVEDRSLIHINEAVFDFPREHSWDTLANFTENILQISCCVSAVPPSKILDDGRPISLCYLLTQLQKDFRCNLSQWRWKLYRSVLANEGHSPSKGPDSRSERSSLRRTCQWSKPRCGKMFTVGSRMPCQSNSPNVRQQRSTAIITFLKRRSTWWIFTIFVGNWLDWSSQRWTSSVNMSDKVIVFTAFHSTLRYVLWNVSALICVARLSIKPVIKFASTSSNWLLSNTNTRLKSEAEKVGLRVNTSNTK